MFIQLGQYRITCYLPKTGQVQQAVYLHTAAKESDKVWNLSTQDFALLAIEGIEWNRDLSPWYREKVFAKGEDFAGKAEEYLAVLTKQLIPQIEAACKITPKFRYLAGYSLGGLFAIFAMYHTSIFDGIGSISGSLWYDGFTAFVESHTIRRNPGKIYFSLGDKETSSACESMRSVLVCTKKIEEKFRQDGITTIFEMNQGNHFKDVPERIWKGIHWLLQL